MTPRTPFDPDLERVRTLFLQMCVRTESMVQQAVRSVLHRDPHMARAVVGADEAVDELEVEIDGLCARYLAQHRPGGVELRLVGTVLKMVTDLGRIGDLAVTIAERGLDLGTGPGLEPSEHLKALGVHVVDMIRLSADAFVSGDDGIHRELKLRDLEVEQLHREGFQHGLLVMAEHPDQAPRALGYSSISRCLERIADHVVAIGEAMALLTTPRP